MLNVRKRISYSCQLISLNTKSNAFYIKKTGEGTKEEAFFVFISLEAS